MPAQKKDLKKKKEASKKRDEKKSALKKKEASKKRAAKKASEKKKEAKKKADAKKKRTVKKKSSPVTRTIVRTVPIYHNWAIGDPRWNMNLWNFYRADAIYGALFRNNKKESVKNVPVQTQRQVATFGTNTPADASDGFVRGSPADMATRNKSRVFGEITPRRKSQNPFANASPLK